MKKVLIGLTLSSALVASSFAGGPVTMDHQSKLFPYATMGVGFGKFNGSKVSDEKSGMWDMKMGVGYRISDNFNLMGHFGVFNGENIKTSSNDVGGAGSPVRYAMQNTIYVQLGAQYTMDKFMVMLAGGVAGASATATTDTRVIPNKHSFSFLGTANVGYQLTDRVAPFVGFQYLFGGNGGVTATGTGASQTYSFNKLSSSWMVLTGFQITL